MDAPRAQYQPDRIGVVSLLSGAGEVEAAFLDRPDPFAPVQIAREGECTLYTRPAAGTCASSCGEQVCTPKNECAPAPKLVSAGVITVTGLRQGLRFRPGPTGYRPDSPPPSELFDVGADIRISAPGDSVPGFLAELSGVPPLDVAVETISLSRDRATRLTWTAAGIGRVALEVTHRPVGQPFARMLLCETDDNGSLTVPPGIVAALGDPAAEQEVVAAMTRFERTVIAMSSGPVEIIVGSRVPVGVARF